MSLIVRRDCPDLPHAALVAHVLGQPGAADRIDVAPSMGASLAGHPTRWYRWAVRPGQPALDGVDHGDQARLESHGGVIAMPVGSETVYVTARGADDSDDIGRAEIESAAGSDGSALQAAGADDLDPDVQGLADALRGAFVGEEGIGVAVWERGARVTWREGRAEVRPVNARVRVQVVLEAYVTGVDRADRDAVEAAEQLALAVVSNDVSPAVEALGLRGSIGDYLVGHGEPDIVSQAGGWYGVFPTVEGAVDVVRALMDLELSERLSAEVADGPVQG